MSDSCCGGTSRAEPAKVTATPAPQVTEAAKTGQATAKSNKSECCNDNSTKNEKHSCGC